MPALSLADNTLLTADRDGAVGFGMIRFDRTAAFAKKCIAHFDVRCSGPDARAASLSGGNLQKFIIGREILQDPIVLIVSQPTWGVDVGAAMVIRQALLDLRSKAPPFWSFPKNSTNCSRSQTASPSSPAAGLPRQRRRG